MINEQKLIAMLVKELAKHGTQSALAKSMGISDAYLSDVLSGNRGAGKKVLASLGLKRVVFYEKV